MIEPTRTQLGFLAVLNEHPESLYAGTANPKQVAARRVRNRMARRSRRINRRR